MGAAQFEFAGPGCPAELAHPIRIQGPRDRPFHRRALHVQTGGIYWIEDMEKRTLIGRNVLSLYLG